MSLENFDRDRTGESFNRVFPARRPEFSQSYVVYAGNHASRARPLTLISRDLIYMYIHIYVFAITTRIFFFNLSMYRKFVQLPDEKNNFGDRIRCILFTQVDTGS